MADRRRIEGNFDQGWPFALFITALAIGAFLTAGYIHKRTFHNPNEALGGPSSATTAPPVGTAEH